MGNEEIDLEEQVQNKSADVLIRKKNDPRERQKN